MSERDRAAERCMLWYADGYHAGLFLRSKERLVALLWEIVRGLRDRPWWKVNLEIEGFTIEELAGSDPELLASMRDWIRQRRLEIIGGSYAQPLPWVMDGESLIGHLKAGKDAVRRELGGHEVETYAVQEPCWSSQFPQVLSGLGYRWCALKNHFTYFGRPPRRATGKALWTGPDGSCIEVSPSYSAFEEKAFNDPGVRGGAEYLQRCLEAGIPDPIAFFIEDIGGAPPSHVEHPPEFIRFATWSEYFRSTSRATEAWRIGQEDFKLALPWGMQSMSELAKQCHALACDVAAAEAFCALASIHSDHRYPSGALDSARKLLMKLQHHDPWLVPEARLGMFADHPFPWWVERWSRECGAVCSREMHAASAALAPGGSAGAESGVGPGSNDVSFRLFNTLGAPRDDLAWIDCRDDAQIYDNLGRHVPGQRVGRHMLVVATVPGFGFRTFHAGPPAEPGPAGRQQGSLQIRRSGRLLSVATPFIEMDLDSERGGCLTRLLHRKTGQELFGDRPGADLAAYLPHGNRFCRSSECGASLTVVEQGPVRVCVLVEGMLSSVPFRTVVYVYRHTPRVDFETTLQFGVGAWAGDPFAVTGWTNRRQSWHIDRRKLQVQFPASLPGARLSKDAAFEVIDSVLEEPFHESWDDVRTNVILNWVDISDGKVGLALFTDRTTSYGFSDHWPLSLILGWGLLQGPRSFRYSLLPHEGTWRDAALPGLAQAMAIPLVTGPAGQPAGGPAADEVSTIAIQPSQVLLSTVFRERGNLCLRLFNALDQETTAAVDCPADWSGRASLADLAANPGAPLEMTATAAAARFQLRLRPFGLATIVLRPPAAGT